jgi:hypothetical protein
MHPAHEYLQRLHEHLPLLGRLTVVALAWTCVLLALWWLHRGGGKGST